MERASRLLVCPRMGFTVLAINPGSTSTKCAIYRDTQEAWKTAVAHTSEDLARFRRLPDQLEYRGAAVREGIADSGIPLAEISAIVGRRWSSQAASGRRLRGERADEGRSAGGKVRQARVESRRASSPIPWQRSWAYQRTSWIPWSWTSLRPLHATPGSPRSPAARSSTP